MDEIESRGSGFDSQGRPTILFERHWFRRLTDGKYDATHPNLSYKYLHPRKNPSYKRDQWTLMDEASKLDAKAAAQSASWGRFQIMGFNWRLVECSSIGEFVERMQAGAREHLLMFVAFVKRKRLDRALAEHDWERFARGYNGADHASNNYVGKLSRAYANHAEPKDEDPQARAQRMLLNG